jgi:dTDP-4-amino-4,6-dideoxygalactose transaminase
MVIDNIPLFKAVNVREMELVAVEVLRSGQIANGEYINQFEAYLSKLYDGKGAVTTDNMTSAMFIALKLAGIRNGDEVMTTSYACLSTNSAIAQHGALPIWIDLKPNTVEIDPDDLIKKITSKTKAVILYHAIGYPGPAKELAEICKKYGIKLIEDCNNALFAMQDDCLVGTFGDYSIFSFYPNRQINAIEGGALICKNYEDAVEARKLRRFGIDQFTFRGSNREININVDIQEIGWSCSLSNLNAAVGLAQISKIDDQMKLVRKNANELTNRISCIKNIKVLQKPVSSNPSYWAFLTLVDNRDQVIDKLNKFGITSSAIHMRNDIYSGFKNNKIEDLKNTVHIQKHILGLPCGWWVNESDIDRIEQGIKEAVNG